MVSRWRDAQQGLTMDSAGSRRLAHWSGPDGWLRIVLHVIANGARTLGGNLLLEVCVLCDRLGRIAAVGGVILGAVAAWDGQWVIVGWTALVVIGGLLAVGLASRALPD